MALHQRGESVLLYARGSRGEGAAESAFDRRAPFAVQRLYGRSWNARQARHVAGGLVPRLRPGDRVLATTWPLAADLAQPCRQLGVPLLVIAHGSAASRLPQPTPPALLRLAAQAHFGAVSSFLQGVLAARGVAARVLPSPVDLADPGDLPREGLLVVARCTPLKGIGRALRLGAALGWPVTVVGEGSELSSLRRLAGELGLEARFAGRLPYHQVVERYRRARLLVQLSRAAGDGGGAEGLGLVVLEAIAHGCPVAVSAVGGLPEAVGPGLVLAEPDDASASAARVAAWLACADVAAHQRAWLAAHHGTALCVDGLLALCQDGGP